MPHMKSTPISIAGVMASHRGEKIHSYTVAYKVDVVEWLRTEGNGNVSLTARKYGVDRKQVREWGNNYDELVAVHVVATTRTRLAFMFCIV